MAELTWDTLLNDPQQYPDSMVWTFENGSQASLGTLRHQMRQATQSQADLETTRMQYQQREQQALQRAERAEQQLIQLLSTPQTLPDQPPQAASVPDFWQTDPGFKPVMDRVNGLAQENANLKTMLTDMQNLQKQMFGTIQQIPVVMSVQKIQGSDPTVDGARLLEFAQQHAIRPDRLDDAHLLMTRQRDLDAAVERGKQLGLEQAKADLAAQVPTAPYAPYGMPQTYVPPPQQFANLDAAMEAAMQDPEVIAAWMNPA